MPTLGEGAQSSAKMSVRKGPVLACEEREGGAELKRSISRLAKGKMGWVAGKKGI